MHIIVKHADEFVGAVMTDRGLSQEEALRLVGVAAEDMQGDDPKYFWDDFQTYSISDDEYARRQETNNWTNLD